MLNIYYGRENTDKEAFMYGEIRKQGYGPGSRVIVIVPDQYTLEAERQAFRHLDVTALVGLEITGFSRLGYNILKELGGSRRPFIDKYGRQMLLTKIAREESENLEIFGGSADKMSFIEMTNDFISDLKQYGVTPEILSDMAESEKNPLLKKKLADLSLIYGKYRDKISGKYTDSEDKIDLYTGKIAESRRIRGAAVWVYGFDSFAPKTMEVLVGIMSAAKEMNVVLTMDDRENGNSRDASLFSLTNHIRDELIGLAEKSGTGMGREVFLRPAPDAARSGHQSDSRFSPESASGGPDRSTVFAPALGQAPAVAHLEHELFATPSVPLRGKPAGITLTAAGNIYGEAESAAAYVLHLLRDKGYRRRDIVIICNDQEVRGPVVERTFGEYGIPLFTDVKRDALNAGAPVYITALLGAVDRRYRQQDVFRALKTGLAGLSAEEVERLEDYAVRYRITGTRWLKPFDKGAADSAFGPEALTELNSLRERAMKPFLRVEAICGKKQTNREFITEFYRYLTDEVNIESKIDEEAARQEEAGLPELSDTTVQIWNKITDIFSQIAEIVGDDRFRTKDFLELFTAGLKALEVGLLPFSPDDLVTGTLQRTRTAAPRAVVVIGANEGTIPQEGENNGLFSEEELESFAKSGHELRRLDRVRAQEERLAIYRDLSRARDELWISYSTSGEDGKELRPSSLIDSLKEIFPDIKTERDILSPDLNAGDLIAPGESYPAPDELLVGGRASTLRHLAESLSRAVRKGEKISPVWHSVRSWYEANSPRDAGLVQAGLAENNSVPRLSGNRPRILFNDRNGRLFISPSGMENYSLCPFSGFISRGLRPEERRVYEAGTRETGDVYHSVIMEITKELNAAGKWDTVTENELRSMLREKIDTARSGYKEGLFRFGGREDYRAGRLEKACFETLNALLYQYRKGAVRESRFEASFGPGRDLGPVVVPAGSGKIYLEGRIDRLDILKNGRLKVIDYKSGKNKFDINAVRAGYSLQLMVYMKAAEQKGGKPAGVFYFYIREPRIDAKTKEEIENSIRDLFRMNGLIVDDEETVREIAGDFDTRSDVVAVRKKKDGTFINDSSIVSDEDFRALEEQVESRLAELAEEMVEGNINISPVRTGRNTTACSHCDFSGICRFDPLFRGNRYRSPRR